MASKSWSSLSEGGINVTELDGNQLLSFHDTSATSCHFDFYCNIDIGVTGVNFVSVFITYKGMSVQSG